MNLSQQSHIKLYPLTIRKDKRHYIVEDSLSGDYFEMPKICIEAINLMNKGESLEEIEKKLVATFPEEEVDMVDFTSQLIELGLVKEIDGEIVQITKENQSPASFIGISPRVGKFFFNKVTIILFIAIFFMNIFLFAMDPVLLPYYQDLFLFDTMMFNMLTFMAITLFLIFMHEFGHVLAMRSYNLPAKLSIGHRLFFVVFETDLTPAWRLEPKQRNNLYLAGMCFDQIMLFIALCIKLAFPEDNTLLTGIAGIVILDIFIKFIYQCSFYMKTDMYYLFENITGCYNVMENGKQFLSKGLPFLKTDKTTEMFDGERNIVRLYSLFYIFGILFTITLFIFYFLPQGVFALSQTLPNLLRPVGSIAFWDAVVFVGQFVLLICFLCYSWMKNR
ncbi:peptidase [Oceanobacillus bengalensis]|uniref:Peptidase n=1 Tax=Oceanobacillus bengalensis TaxID=1435466 RepID=A0A494YZC7_9BACI|nr:peptidase [Oceanobacillus bengalensis]RKQ15577.1 peptidase [Oceanobacillus bengalensis]